jgi:hypothetical protein
MPRIDAKNERHIATVLADPEPAILNNDGCAPKRNDCGHSPARAYCAEATKLASRADARTPSSYFLCFTRLPQGFGGFGTDHYAIAGARLRIDENPCRRRRRDRQHLWLSRQRQAGIVSCNRVGHARERNGDCDGLHGGRARANTQRISQSCRDYRPASLRIGDGCRPPGGPAGGIQSTCRSGAAAGRETDAQTLCLSQDFRRLQ